MVPAVSGHPRLPRRGESGELSGGPGVREGFSEAVAEESSLKDEDSPRWEARKAFQ